MGRICGKAHRSTRLTSPSVVSSAASSCRFDANESLFPLSLPSGAGPGGCFSKSAMVDAVEHCKTA